MPEPDCDEKKPAHETVYAHSMEVGDQSDEPMGEEEKLLVGRTDVNMPALLTRDVAGG